MAIHELSALLWRERELLDLLTFKLEEEQLLLTAGKSRWLPHGTREVEQVLEHLSRTGLARSVEVAAVAQQWGLSADSSLREVATAAPDAAWTEVLSSHLKAMQRQTAAIQELRDSNEQFLRAAVRSTQETAANLQPAAGTYNSQGRTGEAAPSRFLDQKI